MHSNRVPIRINLDIERNSIHRAKEVPNHQPNSHLLNFTLNRIMGEVDDGNWKSTLSIKTIPRTGESQPVNFIDGGWRHKPHKLTKCKQNKQRH